MNDDEALGAFVSLMAGDAERIHEGCAALVIELDKTRAEADRLAILAEIHNEAAKKYKTFLVKAEGYIGLWIHRFNRLEMPEDLEREVRQFKDELREENSGRV